MSKFDTNKKLSIMKKIVFIFFLFSLVLSDIQSQSQRLTLEKVAFAYSYGLYPKTLYDLQWRANTHKFTYIKNWSDIVEQSVDNKQEKVLLTLNELNKQLKNYDLQLNYLLDIHWIDENTFYIIYEKNVIVYDIDQKQIIKLFSLPPQARNITYSPKAKAVAFTIKNNLYYTDSLLITYQITDDKDTNIVNGDSYVHRQEFGIDHGIFWSPNGNYIAFYRKDERMVENYPVIDYTVFPAKLKYLKYPFAGRTSEQVKLGVYHLSTNQIIYMQTGQSADHYLTSITWDPTEKFIYIGILNREQNHLWMNKYNIYNGSLVKTLFEETNPKYVEPLDPLYFLPGSNNKFVYFSQRDGWRHLYLYNTEGNLLRQLTKGNWIVTKLVSFSNDGLYAFIISTKDSPIERHGYKLNLSNGKMVKLTKDHGVHNLIVSQDGKYVLNSYSSTDIPRKIILQQENKPLREVLDVANPLKNYNLGKMSISTIKAADGHTKLYYRLILPPDFDTQKKYPVIVYVYGGPHAQLVLDTYLGGARLWDYFMAQKGYIVFTLDNRGSYNRGFEFESVIHRQLGVNEMKDQIKGVEFLKTLQYVDTTKFGVYGWSFGGFMTASLMTTYPDIFKVGVAGGPVIDWKMYEVMYGERYMDTPQSNPEGYAKTSVLNKIQNLKGKLLLIHGQIDPVVVPQNSLELLRKAQKLNIQVDYYPYPHQEHGVSGKERLHLLTKITNYFDTFLMGKR